ncbi:Uncharacterised protein [Bordetella pertussis]|nr:Uncharacterised protein [Bordetella pertussis]
MAPSNGASPSRPSVTRATSFIRPPSRPYG